MVDLKEFTAPSCFEVPSLRRNPLGPPRNNRKSASLDYLCGSRSGLEEFTSWSAGLKALFPHG
jgi:hypothetical protein